MDIYKFLILLLLVLLSGLFSAGEVAFISLSQAKVRTLAKQKTKAAQILVKLKQTPHRFLSTVLIGNNLLNIGASAYATVIFTEFFGDKGVGYAIGIMTLFVLIFAEIVPKNIAQRNAVKFALGLSQLLYVLQIILTPAIVILEYLTHFLLKIFNVPESKQMTEEELIALATIGVEEGAIDRREKELIQNVLEFNDIKVEEVMIPRTQIHALPDTTTLRETLKFMVTESHHSRIPVFHEKIDDVYGIISVKDMLQMAHAEDLDKPLKQVDLSPVFRVPAVMKINHLFHEFQGRHAHMAVVSDEHGGTAGLVTLEDLLEEIVGEIQDEAEKNESTIQKIDKNSILAEGKTLIEEVNKWFKVKLNAPDFKAVSYILLEFFERFPREGESMQLGPLEFTVEEMDGHMIEKVKIERVKK